MKLNWNRKYTTIAAYALIVILLSIMFVVFILKYDTVKEKASWLMGVLAPVICGIVIAYILNPMVMMFENKLFKKLRDGQITLKDPKAENAQKILAKKRKFRKNAAKTLSIILTYIVVFALLTALCVAVIPNVAQSVMDLSQKMPQYIENLEDFLQDLFKNNPSISMFVSEEFSELSNILMKVTEMIQPMASDIIGTVSTGLFGVVSSVFTALKNVLIGFIISVYLLIGKDRLLAQAKKMLFALLKNDLCQRIIHVGRKTHQIFTTYIISNLVDALIIFAAMYIGTVILKTPYAMLVSLVCGVTNLIPFFGPFIGAIVCGILIVLVDPVAVIWFEILVLVAQQCDGNIIKPLLFGESTGLPAIWVLVSIIVFGGMFGVAGMLLAVPVFAMIYFLFAEYVVNKLKKKKLPTDTNRYFEVSQYENGYAEPEEV